MQTFLFRKLFIKTLLHNRKKQNVWKPLQEENPRLKAESG